MHAAEPSVTESLRFARPWRPYQQRVLDALDRHLEDDRIHVVAAPGSGKTVLGLELVRRLGKPALVLSPTTAIRDQWIRRLADFLPPGAAPPDWASAELGAPGFLTSVTYQALHRGVGEPERPAGDEDGEDDEEVPAVPTAAELAALAGTLRAARVGTLVLDEAHHLRQAWWKALTALGEALGPGLTLISLTATPPYDVPSGEWRRYEELCGPIDEEISAPELVRSGSLCPHQDLVWGVEVSGEAATRLERHEARLEALLAELHRDDALLRAVLAHPWLSTPDPEAVLADTEAAVALLVLAKSRGALPSDAPLLALLGVTPGEVPAPSVRFWNALLTLYLGSGSFAPEPAHRDALARRLRADRLLVGRTLRLDRPPAAEHELFASPAKLDACVRIHALEAEVRGTTLRQVFLTDFIREDEPAERPRLGAWPLFRALTAAAPAAGHPHLALVTGRLAIVHRTLLPLLARPGEPLPAASPAPGLPDGFVRLASPGSALLPALTLALEDGALRVLVGTRALLGEGWDAPGLNSLVLATYSGSFVLTNQMRGRAIRLSPAAPEKVASIWHLVAVAPRTRHGWRDLEELGRRFDVFVGVGAFEPILESGIGRLRLPAPGTGWCEAVNGASTAQLEHLGQIGERWARAIGGGAFGRVLPAVQPVAPPRFRRRLFRDTLRRLLATSATAFGLGFTGVMRLGSRFEADLRTLLLLVAGACLVGFAFSLPGLVRALVTLARHLPVDGHVRQLAAALRDALVEAGIVREGARDSLRVTEVAPGEFAVTFVGASFRDSAVFADCLDELLGPVENPRYLLEREGDLPLLGRRVDHHAVPAPLGRKAETAQLLADAFRRRLGTGRLVWTRSAEGRAALLRARARAFSAAFRSASHRLDRWH